MKFEDLVNRFIRGAVFSRIEEAIFLVEANHNLYTLRALPAMNAMFLSVENASFLEQAQFVSMQEAPAVKQMKLVDGKEVRWCTRTYTIFTSHGTAKVTITSDEVDDADNLRLELAEETGYPPEDAKRLEDFTA